jgi:hypothetical protein
MSQIKVVVTCVAGTVSGGPEALHQLVDMLNQVEPGSGAICYAPYGGRHNTFPQYQRYNIPIVMKSQIPDDAIVVFPEILPHHSVEFHQRKALWWLSVENFVKDHSIYFDNFSYHLTQSEYARQYLETLGLQSSMLTDYINDVFADSTEYTKLDQVCVNPSKGAHLINDFKQHNSSLQIIELTQMSREAVKDHLSSSKIYIDFGHHPGRDRFPREAVLSDCVVLATKYGSAKNNIDIPIDSWYKFESFNEIPEKIHSIYNDYNRHLSAQAGYKNIVKVQKDIFRNEVQKLLELY